jgi:uncharacterized protein YegP (UPF0339 family)
LKSARVPHESPPAESPPLDRRQAHFQLFATDGHAEIRWRLLSANNRELGRGVVAYPDAEACLLAIKQLLIALDDLQSRVRRKDGLWQWVLLADNEHVVLGSHLFDRQVRCELAVSQFRSFARGAKPAEGVMLTGARRWNSAAAVRRPLQDRPPMQVRGLLR